MEVNSWELHPLADCPGKGHHARGDLLLLPAGGERERFLLFLWSVEGIRSCGEAAFIPQKLKEEVLLHQGRQLKVFSLGDGLLGPGPQAMGLPREEKYATLLFRFAYLFSPLFLAI